MQGTRDRGVHVLPPRGRFELMGERPNAALWRDKFVQKQHFSAAAVPLGPFRSVASVSDACAAARECVPSSLSVAVRARWHLSCSEYLASVGQRAPRIISVPPEDPSRTPCAPTAQIRVPADAQGAKAVIRWQGQRGRAV